MISTYRSTHLVSSVRCTNTAIGDSAVTVGVIPMHVTARPGLEDIAVSPAIQPSMVVSSPSSSRISGEHRLYFSASKKFPVPIAEDLAIFERRVAFAAVPASVRSTDLEDLASGSKAGRLVASHNDHIRPSSPGLSREIVDAGFLGVLTAGDEDFAIRVTRHARAEHVVAGVCDLGVSDIACFEV